MFTRGPVVLGRDQLLIIAILCAWLAPAADLRAQCSTCLGDVSGDGLIDGRDIPGFTVCVIGGSPAGPCACANMNADGVIDLANDVPLFVSTLLFGTGPCPINQTLTLTLDDPLVGKTRTINGIVCLSNPAGPGGVTVTLNSLDPSIATIAPAMTTIPEGDTCAPVSVTGVDFGTTTVTADAPGWTQGTAQITVTTQIISLGYGLQLIPGQTAGLPLSLSVAAPPGGVTVSLMSSNPGIATVTPSVFIPAGQQLPASNPQVTGVAFGTVDITASTPNFAPDTRQVVVGSNVITLNPTTLNVVQSQSADMTVTLQVSAPAGGQTIDLITDNPGIATVQATAFIPAGENSIDVPVNGIGLGTTTLRASHAASGIPETTATINVGPAGINLTGDVIGDDLMVIAYGTLTAAAPAGNLLISLTSSDANSLLLSNDPTAAGAASINVTVAAGSTSIPTFYVHALVDGGSAGVTATAPNYNPGSATFSFAPSGFIIWSPGAINTVTNLPPTSVQLRPVRLDPATLTYVQNQYVRGGLTVNVDVTSSVPAVGTVSPSPVVFTGGEYYDTTAFDPVAAGISVIGLATPAGFDTPSHYQSITANVSDQGIVLTNYTIGDDLQVPAYGYLTSPAPAGNLNVTITSADPARLLLSNNATTMGSTSIIVTVGAGSTNLPPFYVQALDDSGTVDITATASGYGAGTATMTLQPSGFIIWSPGVINTVNNNPPTSIQIRPVRLDPVTLNYQENQYIRGGATVYVDMVSSVPSVGTITVTPVTFTGNEYYDTTAFDPNSAGTTQLSLITPPDFETPSNYQSIAANVSAQGINLPNHTIGDDLQMQSYGTLTAAAPAGNLDVTITSADSARLLLATTLTAAGSASIVVTVPAGGFNLPAFYIQALDDTGTVDITATAPGYGAGTSTMTLQPSGFIIWSPGNFTTTTFASPTSIQIRPVRLDPATMLYQENQYLRGGITANVDVTSSDINVGTITLLPIVFSGEYYDTTGFDPLIAGTSTIGLATPAGFDTPAHYQSIVATVRAPNINLADTTVGEDLQTPQFISLENAPPNPVDVTVTVNNPNIATISTDPLAAGSGSVTFMNVASTSVGTIYVQGRMQGFSTTLTVQAAGYSDRIADATVRPSGFIIWSPGNFSTTTFSSPTSIQIRPVRLNPVTLNYEENQYLRGGVNVDVSVTSSNTGVGTMMVSPIAFTANEYYDLTAFDPANAGTSTISLATPVGFETPSQYQSITATVTAPDIFISNMTVGEDLQTYQFVSLAATPPAPVDVTVSVADSAIATLSTDPLVAGGGSVTFTGVSTTSVGIVYVQGRTQGMNTALTASATGYNTSNRTVTVHPSGFIIWTPSSFETTTYSVPTSIQIRPTRLNPTTLNYEENQYIRGGLNVDVDVTSSDTNVGTITVSPLAFTANEYYDLTAFDPNNIGASTINVVTPTGFDTPSNYQMITATVSTPDIFMGDVTVGDELQTALSITLEAAPPAPVDVTITAADSAIATLSSDPLLAGGASVTFFGVSTTTVGTFYVQGRTQGNTTLTASAGGYNNDNSNVIVDPAGFMIWSPSSISTTAGAANTSVQIRPVRLNPVTLNYVENQYLRGGIGTVDVTVNCSDTNVGVITITPVVFSANEYYEITEFDPIAAGSATISLMTPAGFTTPSNYQAIPVTVSP